VRAQDATQYPLSDIRDDPTPRERAIHQSNSGNPFHYMQGGRYDGKNPPTPPRMLPQSHSQHRRPLSPDTPLSAQSLSPHRMSRSEPTQRPTHEERMAQNGLQATKTYSKRKPTAYILPQKATQLDDGISYRYDRKKRPFSTSIWPPSPNELNAEVERPCTPYFPESPPVLPGEGLHSLYEPVRDGGQDKDEEEEERETRPRKRRAVARNGARPEERIDGLFDYDSTDGPRAVRRDRGEIAFTEAFKPDPNSQYTQPEYVIRRHNGRFVTTDKTERRGERVNRDYGNPALQMTSSTQGQENLDR